MELVTITLEQVNTDCFLFLCSHRRCQDSFWSGSIVSSSWAFVPDERDSVCWGLGLCSPWRNIFSYMTHCSTDMRATLFCFFSKFSNLILEKYVQAKSAHPHRPAVGCFKRHVGEFVLSLFLSSRLKIIDWTCVRGLKRSCSCLWQLSYLERATTFLLKVKANSLVRCSVLLQVCFSRDANTCSLR